MNIFTPKRRLRRGFPGFPKRFSADEDGHDDGNPLNRMLQRYGKRNQYMLLRKGRDTSSEEAELELIKIEVKFHFLSVSVLSLL